MNIRPVSMYSFGCDCGRCKKANPIPEKRINSIEDKPNPLNPEKTVTLSQTREVSEREMLADIRAAIAREHARMNMHDRYLREDKMF